MVYYISKYGMHNRYYMCPKRRGMSCRTGALAFSCRVVRDNETSTAAVLLFQERIVIATITSKYGAKDGLHQSIARSHFVECSS